MPNWCWNNLEVTGDEIQLREFVEKSLIDNENPDKFSFDGTFPMPKEFEEIRTGAYTDENGESHRKWREIDGKNIPVTDKEMKQFKKKYGSDNWWDWSINNWGTKWDACESLIYNNDINFFCVSFDTAWGPPVEWIDNIMQDFPDLCFILEYSEEGMGFGGRLTAQYNVIWDDLNWDIDYASDCCSAEVYNIDDEEFTLPKIPLKKLKTWTGKDKIWKTVKDIPEYHKYPDYQCGICGEECETITKNAAEIKSAKTKIIKIK
jgi:hypothetical protein